jgi:hypothetical protein
MKAPVDVPEDELAETKRYAKAGASTKLVTVSKWAKLRREP